VWSPWGGGGIGAQQAFAAAIAQVEAAGTFACRQIVTEMKDGQPVVREMSFVFKEPDLERIEYGEGMPMPGEYTVTDYAKRKRLTVRPDDKEAGLQDLSDSYTVDVKTGGLKPTEIGTHARDDVLRISAQAVQDLGMSKVGDRPVWVLQSKGEAEPVKTVYVDPQTGKPVQVALAWPSTGQTFVYANIQIDVPLDDSLFSLEPPAGYAFREYNPTNEHYGKVMPKLMHVMRECYTYAHKHDGKWPNRLEDLTANGMDANALCTMLAPHDQPNGKPIVVYRRPADGEQNSETVVVYEAPESRRGGHVAVGFLDCHAEVLTEKQFEEALKK
jgi:outer membrane lipoprotein-sorting protein